MVHSTETFLWDKENGVFSCEASTLGWNQIPMEFDLKSSRTGRTVTMEGVQVERDSEGESQAWIYKPKGGNMHFKVVVFND